MKQTSLLLIFSALTAVWGHGATLPSFEVASITACKPGTPEPPGEHAGMVQFIYPGGRFEARATSVKYLLEWSHGILAAQHTGGPAWIGEDRFDIVTKAPGKVTDDEMKQMAQRLLVERFQLRAHHETREVPVLAIQVGKTAPKLYPAKDGEEHALKMQPKMGDNGKVVTYHIVATRFSLAQLNDVFSRHLDRVIVNQTGMSGDYDFELDFTPDETAPNPLDATHILNAMHEQLGFVLKTEKAPVDFLVIDSVEHPAGN